MEPVRLSHRDRGPRQPPPAPALSSSTGGPILPLRPPLSSRSVCISGDTAEEEEEDDDAAGADESGTEQAALRRLDEDRLLAALLADSGGPDLGKHSA